MADTKKMSNNELVPLSEIVDYDNTEVEHSVDPSDICGLQVAFNPFESVWEVCLVLGNTTLKLDTCYLTNTANAHAKAKCDSINRFLSENDIDKELVPLAEIVNCDETEMTHYIVPSDIQRVEVVRNRDLLEWEVNLVMVHTTIRLNSFFKKENATSCANTSRELINGFRKEAE